MSEPVGKPTPKAAPHLTVTRLRLGWTRPFVLARFLKLSLTNARAARTRHGFSAGALWVDARLTFWTVTLLKNDASMRKYAYGPTHIGAMKHLRKYQDAYTEAAFASGVSPTAQLPTAAEAYTFLTARATFYDLPKASSDQRAHHIQAPRVRTVRRLEALSAETSPL